MSSAPPTEVMGKRTVALSIIAIVIVSVVIIFAPTVYNPAIPADCNFKCADLGYSPHYNSISAQLTGQGATYWVLPAVSPEPRYCLSFWFIGSNCQSNYGYPI